MTELMSEAVELRLERARIGDIGAARDALRDAVIAINTIAAGDRPERWRVACLLYLRDAIVQILDHDIPPTKALGTSPGEVGAPKKDTFDRDFVLFYRVGKALSRNEEACDPVDAAIREVARRHKWSRSTVKNAWQRFKGKSGWERQFAGRSES